MDQVVERTDLAYLAETFEPNKELIGQQILKPLAVGPWYRFRVTDLDRRLKRYGMLARDAAPVRRKVVTGREVTGEMWEWGTARTISRGEMDDLYELDPASVEKEIAMQTELANNEVLLDIEYYIKEEIDDAIHEYTTGDGAHRRVQRASALWNGGYEGILYDLHNMMKKFRRLNMKDANVIFGNPDLIDRAGAILGGQGGDEMAERIIHRGIADEYPTLYGLSILRAMGQYDTSDESSGMTHNADYIYSDNYLYFAYVEPEELSTIQPKKTLGVIAEGKFKQTGNAYRAREIPETEKGANWELEYYYRATPLLLEADCVMALVGPGDLVDGRYPGLFTEDLAPPEA